MSGRAVQGKTAMVPEFLVVKASSYEPVQGQGESIAGANTLINKGHGVSSWVRNWRLDNGLACSSCEKVSFGTRTGGMASPYSSCTKMYGAPHKMSTQGP
jgi:hypothetical protein